jgi:hypothetical protein
MEDQISKNVVNFTTRQRCHVYLSINQKDERLFAKELCYEFAVFRYVLAKKEGQQYKFINGDFVSLRNIQMDLTLDAGEYLFLIEIYWS